MKAKKNFWDKNKYFLISVSFVLTLFALWELFAVIFKVDSFVLPKFSAVLKEFFLLFKNSAFYRQLLGTLSRVLIALSLAILVGVFLGICSANRYIRACLRPVVATIKSIPVMAITLIILINFDKNSAPFVIGFLMAFPIMYNATILGIDSIDKELVEISKVYSVSVKNKVFKIWIPLMLPSVFSGIETSGGMCVKAVISAEILCYTINSLGLAMHVAKSSLEPKDVAILFAYCLVAILLSLAIEFIVKLISKPLLSWK